MLEMTAILARGIVCYCCQHVSTDEIVARNLKKVTFASGPGQRSGQYRIAAVLGGQILSGARKPGERLPNDAEMLETFGVSRVVTREVMKTLAAKGMVAPKMKTGTTVLDASHWNWFDRDVLSWRAATSIDLEFMGRVTEIRRAVEPVAAGLAALRRTRADVLRLRNALTSMARSKEDSRQFSEADLSFHLAVSIASQNPFFQSFAGIIQTALSAESLLHAATDAGKRRAHALATHTAVADAIEARDEEAAKDAMLITINDGINNAKLAFKKSNA